MPTTQTVVVASQNPAKIGAAEDGFRKMFPDQQFAFRSISVPSGVATQPFTDADTLQGAQNRAQNAREADPGADYWIGLEGGVDAGPEGQAGTGPIQSFAWMAVVNKNGRVGKARTATYYQPEETAKLLREGVELGRADEMVHGRINSRQGSGSVGILTGDAIDRRKYYAEAVGLALIPFKNTTLTFA